MAKHLASEYHNETNTNKIEISGRNCVLPSFQNFEEKNMPSIIPGWLFSFSNCVDSEIFI